MTQTIIIRSDAQRALAKRLIDAAPVDAVVTIKEATRSVEANNLLWSMLSDISRAKPQGRKMIPERWKAVMMAACGHAVQFEVGLDGNPFPVGFRSSRLTKVQMSDLIDFVGAYGAEHGVRWSL